MFEIKGIKGKGTGGGSFSHQTSEANAEGSEKPVKEKECNLIDFKRDQRIFMPHKNLMNLQGAYWA